MTGTPSSLLRRARERQRRLDRLRSDPRFGRVLGRYVAEGLLTLNFPVDAHRERIEVADALWTGELEPRVLELLPAMILKTPAVFVDVRDLPPDLDDVVRTLRRDETPPDFRGIPGAAIRSWVPRVGRKDKLPTQLKAFRFGASDLQLLRQLASDLGINETEVVRRGLRALAAERLGPRTRRARRGE